jgi:exodeoxyribonuclease-5
MTTTNSTALHLTAEQMEAVQAAIRTAEQAGHMSLIGPAGCGKTTTIRAIAQEAVRRWPGKTVLLLAPTHKARQQFAAAKLPRGVNRQTIQRFIGVNPSTWRDEDKFNLANDGDLRRVESARTMYSLVIVDESSMVCGQYAKKALQICAAAHVGIVFSGDPYQLPPVSNNDKTEDDPEGPDVEATENTLAAEFIDAPVKVLLTEVLRHGGPILQYATYIRKNWELEHTFPAASVKDCASEIRVSAEPMRDFINYYMNLYDQLGSGLIDYQAIYRQSPRALCYTNGSVHRYTHQLRRQSLGARAGSQWLPGELVMVKHYCACATPRFIPSATDAIVTGSHVVNIDESFNLCWKTAKLKRERSETLVYKAQAQMLELRLIRPDGSIDESCPYSVGTPLIGDKESIEVHQSIKRKLISTGLSSDHDSWKWFKRIKDTYRNTITSAFVMTVHSSQGSTFRDVFVCQDILRADKDRNSLLYVAATRASHSITFGCP